MILTSKILTPYEGIEEVVPGTQEFSSSGSFVAPYTTEYTLTLYPSSAGTARGGYGSRAIMTYSDRQYKTTGGNGGGGSGSCFYTTTPLIVKQSLKKGESVLVTISTNMISFGSYASIATGSKPSNGGDASDSSTGNGSASGTTSTATYIGTLVQSIGNYTHNVSGRSGRRGTTDVSYSPGDINVTGGDGGSGADPTKNAYIINVGAGQDGQSISNGTGVTQYGPYNGVAATTGKIQISW